MAICAVRSNCRPAVTEKSASSTTFAQGPGQAAGGVYENVFGLKSANCRFENSSTVQGVVGGRGTGGSAVTVFGEPMVGAGGAGDTCDAAADAMSPAGGQSGRAVPGTARPRLLARPRPARNAVTVCQRERRKGRVMARPPMGDSAVIQAMPWYRETSGGGPARGAETREGGSGRREVGFADAIRAGPFFRASALGAGVQFPGGRDGGAAGPRT